MLKNVVIIGDGFGGLEIALSLKNRDYHPSYQEYPVWNFVIPYEYSRRCGSPEFHENQEL
jgi:hypothetical protein